MLKTLKITPTVKLIMVIHLSMLLFTLAQQRNMQQKWSFHTIDDYNSLYAQQATTPPPKNLQEKDFTYFRSQQTNNNDATQATVENNAEEQIPLAPSATKALYSMDVHALAEILVHDGGRVKPLLSYAQTTLLILNGRSTFRDEGGNSYTALEWLTHTLFEPEQVLNDRVFKITYQDALYALGVAPHDSKRYSFRDLSQGINELQQLANFAYQKVAENRNALDKEWIRIYEGYILYYQLLSSFLYALPSQTFVVVDAEVKALLGLAAQRTIFSYLEIMENSAQLFQLDELARAKPKQTLTSSDIILSELANRYRQFPLSFSDLPFRLFPSYAHAEERWFSPWQIFAINTEENLVKKEVFAIKNIVAAYRAQDQNAFNRAIATYQSYIHPKLAQTATISRAQWEVRYHRLDPIYRSSIIYGLAFLCMIGSFAFPVQRRLRWSLKLGATGLLFLGLTLTLGGIIMRMIITARPPITNLYSTFVFVAFVTGLGGVLLEKYEKQGIGLLTGAFSATILLLISNYFAAEGDTLHVLVAVLRSNFWLSTHVIAINLGYGGIVLSGVIAHVYLIKRLGLGNPLKRLNKHTSATALLGSGGALLSSRPEETADALPPSPAARKSLRNVFKLIYATQGIGLIFTVLGTILGGVWADQSWGRFWGWDPKENGSLLIILWSAIIFHSKMGGILRELGFAIGAVIGIIVVMIAWFGINLLGVGLHSYGFTDGIAFPLLFYIVGQLTVLSFFAYFIKTLDKMRRAR